MTVLHIDYVAVGRAALATQEGRAAYCRVRRACCEESTIPDLHEHALRIVGGVLVAQEWARRRRVAEERRRIERARGFLPSPRQAA